MRIHPEETVEMKKTLIALAVLAPLAAAHAQSTVTLYGLIDTSISIGDSGGPEGRVTRIDSGTGAGSRWGMRGAEDLGGGLSAVFTAESGFDASTGASQQGGLLFGRQLFVGLTSKSGWGVTLGRQLSPSNVSMATVDAMGQNHWGSTSNSGLGTLQSPGSAAVQGAGCQGATTRINNSVLGSYSSNGFTGRLMLGAGDENAQKSGRLLSPSLTYESGPLTLTAAYTRIGQCTQDIAAGSRPGWQTETVVGGAYNFGPASVFAGYYNFNPSETNKVVGPTTFTNHRLAWLGTRIPVGAVGTIKAQVAQFRQEMSGGDAKGTSLGVAYLHGLSKRTTLFVSAARMNNNEKASFGLVGATASQPAGGLGLDPQVISFGITHVF
ncbi:MAG: porin [Comamonadaceae bacterium]|nr:MAG: porin [Comamonadaceae bacterium]